MIFPTLADLEAERLKRDDAHEALSKIYAPLVQKYKTYVMDLARQRPVSADDIRSHPDFMADTISFKPATGGYSNNWIASCFRGMKKVGYKESATGGRKASVIALWGLK